MAELFKRSGEDILGILVASDELLLEKLFKQLQDYLIGKEEDWIKKNYVLVLHTVFKLPSCKKLQEYCIESICEDPQPLFTSKDFPSLDRIIFYELFKRVDLCIEEVVAWDSLIKWGIGQTSCLGSKNSDRTKWNDKFRPYKAIIPHYVCEEVEEFYFKGTHQNQNVTSTSWKSSNHI